MLVVGRPLLEVGEAGPPPRADRGLIPEVGIDRHARPASLLEQVARELNIPFAVGGGVRSVEDAEALLRAGADKVSMNSAALADPALITHAAAFAIEEGYRCTRELLGAGAGAAGPDRSPRSP